MPHRRTGMKAATLGWRRRSMPGYYGTDCGSKTYSSYSKKYPRSRAKRLVCSSLEQGRFNPHQAASKRRGHAGRRSCRKRRLPHRHWSRSSQLQQTPRAAAPAAYCGIWGIRLFDCHIQALQIRVSSLCRCTRRSA